MTDEPCVKDTLSQLPPHAPQVETAKADVYDAAAAWNCAMTKEQDAEASVAFKASLDALIAAVRASLVTPDSYDFDKEARIVCDAIGSPVGHMTVMCALREAYEAGNRSLPDSVQVSRQEQIEHDLGNNLLDSCRTSIGV